MSQEDALVNAIIESQEGREYTEFEPEVPYNNYGSRGVVDLVETSEMPISNEQRIWSGRYGLRRSNLSFNAIKVYEIKSPVALENSTGANEILRQCNSHGKYFFKGSDYSANDYDIIRYELIFTNHAVCMDHLLENEGMYKSSDWRVIIGDSDTGNIIRLRDLKDKFESMESDRDIPSQYGAKTDEQKKAREEAVKEIYDDIGFELAQP